MVFALECPDCGTVDLVRDGGRRWRSPNFNPVTRRWMCRHCRRLFAIGLAVWPVAHTGNRPRRGNRQPPWPPDTQSKPEHWPALRQLYGAVRQPARRGALVNLMDCPCLDRDDIDPACPFHGPDA
jgi:hypothetical protein